MKNEGERLQFSCKWMSIEQWWQPRDILDIQEREHVAAAGAKQPRDKSNKKLERIDDSPDFLSFY